MLYNRYHEVVENYLKEGMAEEIPREEIVASSVTHYLPHHAVMRRQGNNAKGFV